MTHRLLGKADLHIHSNHSDGTASIPQIMQYVAERTDLDVIAITDHNTIEGALFAQSLADLYDFEVVVGEEISTTEGHVIGLYLTSHVPAGMSPAETIAAIRAQGGIAIVAHPFSAQGVFGPLGRRGFGAAAESWGFHAMETYNSLPFLAWANRAAARIFAGTASVAETGGSDAHFVESVGRGFTRFAGRSAEDLRVAIQACDTAADSIRHGWTFLWRLAKNYGKIRRLQAWNWERCKAN